MKQIYFFLCLIFITNLLSAQEVKQDSIQVREITGIEVTAVRTKVPLKEIPASISIVDKEQLGKLSKTIAADEALRLVPGVRIENGTSASRVHLYIRGQGVLTESGFRGIGVMVDGITINDPAGFAPDLFDVDWATVSNVEVVKGLAASLYGTGSTGGILNIKTEDGGKKPFNSTVYFSAGSNGFWKALGQVDGTEGNINYRVSYSHTQGHGYRVHQAFMGDNFSEKLNWTPSSKIKITQLLTYTSYFNQNSEGINLGRYDTVGPTAANTDAIPFNEFHKTKRLTGALMGRFDIASNQDVQLKVFGRMNDYRETSNNGDDRKPFTNGGVSGQYSLNLGSGNLKNHLTLGVDYQSKVLTETMFGVKSNPDRVDTYFGEDIIDTDTILVNQIIKQRSAGIFVIDKLDISRKLYATVNIRYDYIYNQLINNIPLPDSITPSSGNRDFNSPSFRIGLAYDAAKFMNIYANYGTGFLVPTEDELYNNPAHWGGFNETIEPSKMYGAELGLRGNLMKNLYYDITGYFVNSKDEFYRYGIPGRGNNTAFFGNIGASERYGIETFISYKPLDFLRLDVAYTYSHCQYTSPDSVSGHWIPQCPVHILHAEASVDFLKNFTFTLATEYQSKWYIQVDDSIYNQYTENGIKRNSWVSGYNIWNADLKYHFVIGGIHSEISLFAKNMFDEHYFGFTEPNNGPDYNSYQPAPGREFFISLRLRL